MVRALAGRAGVLLLPLVLALANCCCAAPVSRALSEGTFVLGRSEGAEVVVDNTAALPRRQVLQVEEAESQAAYGTEQTPARRVRKVRKSN